MGQCMKQETIKKQEMVKYDNRIVPKEGFRAFIYHVDGTRKLANSWEEFEACVQTGTWFSSAQVAGEKQKTKKKGD
jgi:hypothetical protein